MIPQRFKIIVGDAGFEPGTSNSNVWCATPMSHHISSKEPPHLLKRAIISPLGHLISSKEPPYLLKRPTISPQKSHHISSEPPHLLYLFAAVFHWPWPENDERWIWVVTKLTYPLNNTSFCCSVFLTVVIAGER